MAARLCVINDRGVLCKGTIFAYMTQCTIKSRLFPLPTEGKQFDFFPSNDISLTPLTNDEIEIYKYGFEMGKIEGKRIAAQKPV